MSQTPPKAKNKCNFIGHQYWEFKYRCFICGHLTREEK